MEIVHRFIKNKPKSCVVAQWKYVAINSCWICTLHERNIQDYETAFTIEKW